MSRPTVSIVMPVYNGEKYLKEAIDSILGQTYKDFEFIIIDDGSNDRTAKIVQSYKDSRIRFITHENKGLSASCNEGITMAKGKYIARQDADDISELNRLQTQVDFMEKNKNIGLVGSNYRVMDENGAVSITTDVFTNPKDLKLAEIFSNQFGHGTVLIRSETLKKPYYDSIYKSAQDVDLWSRISHYSDLANIREPLYRWRLAGEGLSTKPENVQANKDEVYQIRDREFQYFLHHKKNYALLSLHPLSTRGGIRSYLGTKSTMYRNMTLMYCYSGHRRLAFPALLLATFYQPAESKNYRFMKIIVFKPALIGNLGYESL